MNKDIDNKAGNAGLEQECEEQNMQDSAKEECAETSSETSEKECAKEPKDALEEANAKIEELKDKYLRKVAEFDNYVKRTRKEKDELIFNGGEKTIDAVLPIIDDMERAIANAGKTDDAKAIEEGWELIFKKFIKVLE